MSEKLPVTAWKCPQCDSWRPPHIADGLCFHGGKLVDVNEPLFGTEALIRVAERAYDESRIPEEWRRKLATDLVKRMIAGEP